MSKKSKGRSYWSYIVFLVLLVILPIIIAFDFVEFDSDMFMYEKGTVEKEKEKTKSKKNGEVTEKKEEIEEIKDRPEFKERVNLEAERIYWEEKKEKLETDYAEEKDEVEGQLENLREEELSF